MKIFSSMILSVFSFSLSAHAGVTVLELQKKMDRCTSDFLRSFCHLVKGENKSTENWQCTGDGFKIEGEAIAVREKSFLGLKKKFILDPRGTWIGAWIGPKPVSSLDQDDIISDDPTPSPSFSIENNEHYPGVLAFFADLVRNVSTDPVLNNQSFFGFEDGAQFPYISFYRHDVKFNHSFADSWVRKYKIVTSKTKVKNGDIILRDEFDQAPRRYSVSSLMAEFSVCLQN